jgi:hypothetical protein
MSAGFFKICQAFEMLMDRFRRAFFIYMRVITQMNTALAMWSGGITMRGRNYAQGFYTFRVTETGGP